MSPEPEKRSDEEAWARLADAATPGPWAVEEATEAKRFYIDTMPLTADVNGAGEPVAYGGPAEDGGPHVGACRLPDAAFIAAAREAVPALLAALAASRAAERWQKACMGEAKERDEFAREVSQLRAKIERVEAFCDFWEAPTRRRMPAANWVHLVRAALAEPLGSTPGRCEHGETWAHNHFAQSCPGPLGSTEDPPATEENR